MKTRLLEGQIESLIPDIMGIIKTFVPGFEGRLERRSESELNTNAIPSFSVPFDKLVSQQVLTAEKRDIICYAYLSTCLDAEEIVAEAIAKNLINPELIPCNDWGIGAEMFYQKLVSIGELLASSTNETADNYTKAMYFVLISGYFQSDSIPALPEPIRLAEQELRDLLDQQIKIPFPNLNTNNLRRYELILLLITLQELVSTEKQDSYTAIFEALQQVQPREEVAEVIGLANTKEGSITLNTSNQDNLKLVAFLAVLVSLIGAVNLHSGKAPLLETLSYLSLAMGSLYKLIEENRFLKKVSMHEVVHLLKMYKGLGFIDFHQIDSES